MDYDGPPLTPDGRAAALAEGRAVMWCERPMLDGRAAVDEHLCVEGWAYCERELEEVVVVVDGHPHAAHHGLPRPDVDDALTGFDGHVSGFMHVLDTRDWAPGPHEVSVVAVGRDGSAVGQGGTVTRGADLPYRVWRDRGGQATVGALDASSARLEGQRLILCVLETGASGAPLAESLARQSHRDWKPGPGNLRDTLEEVARDEVRAVIVEDSGFLDPAALARLSAAFATDTPADVVYADEDAVTADGGRGRAFFKPGWSPELLLSTDYVGPLVAVGPRAARFALDAAPDSPATIYELLLRVVDVPVRVERVPGVLFTSLHPRVPEDGPGVRVALERLASMRGRRARVRGLALPGAREVSWEVDGAPLVSVVIPTRYSRGLVRECLRSIRERTTYENLEVVIVDSSAEQLASGELELAGLRHRVVSYEGEFNFSTAVNRAARAARGDYLLLLNDDTEVLSPDWMEKMLAQAQSPGVGVVGCRLVYPDGRVQHGGVAVHAGMPWHLYLGFPADAPGYRGMLALERNCSAVTGACMLMSSDLFERLGGLDESMAINYADTDFCLRAVEAGRRVVWTPHAVLVHHERSSFSPRAGSADFAGFNGRWSTPYAEGDPFYHPAFMPSLYYELPLEGPGPASPPSLPDLEDLGPPPRSAEEIAAAISSGRPVMWCDKPELDTDLAAFGFIHVVGWAYAKGGIEVFVYLDGRPYRPRLGMIRGDLSSSFGEGLGSAGFTLLIDLDAHRAGRLELVVAARTSGGIMAGVRGEVECRPTPAGVRPPEWEQPGPPGEADVLGAGRRFAPDGWRGRLTALERESLYRWADGLAGARDVLDVGCGVGHGTSILAHGARHALGVDVSAEAIDAACERAGEQAEFVVGDLHELPCEDRSFDLATCFETIDHVLDPGRVLDELRRVLRPDGVALVSSPDPGVRAPGNPLRVRDYTSAELEDALAARFAHTRPYRQRNHLASVIRGDEASALAHLDQQHDTETGDGVTGAAGEAVRTVVAASDAPLPSLPSIGAVGEVVHVEGWYERALAWEERALVAEARAQAHEATRHTAEVELERLVALHRRESRRTRRSLRRAKVKLGRKRRRRSRAHRNARRYEASLSWRLTGPVRALLGSSAWRGLMNRIRRRC